jgi:hypothetical protein
MVFSMVLPRLRLIPWKVYIPPIFSRAFRAAFSFRKRARRRSSLGFS